MSSEWHFFWCLFTLRVCGNLAQQVFKNDETQPSLKHPPSCGGISMETFRRWLNNVIMFSIHEDTWFERWFNYEAKGRKKFFVCSFSSNFPTTPSSCQGTFLFRAVLSFHCWWGWILKKPKQKRDKEFVVSLWTVV